MPGPVKGRFFYLYLILDIYSRKIVGWEVHVLRVNLGEKPINPLSVEPGDPVPNDLQAHTPTCAPQFGLRHRG